MDLVYAKTFAASTGFHFLEGSLHTRAYCNRRNEFCAHGIREVDHPFPLLLGEDISQTDMVGLSGARP